MHQPCYPMGANGLPRHGTTCSDERDGIALGVVFLAKLFLPRQGSGEAKPPLPTPPRTSGCRAAAAAAFASRLPRTVAWTARLWRVSRGRTAVRGLGERGGRPGAGETTSDENRGRGGLDADSRRAAAHGDSAPRHAAVWAVSAPSGGHDV